MADKLLIVKDNGASGLAIQRIEAADAKTMLDVPVVDGTLSVAGAAADAKAAGDGIKGALDQTNAQNTNSIILEQGYYAIADGTKTDSNGWVRTKTFISNSTSISTVMPIRFVIQAYKITGEYVGTWNPTTKTFETSYASHQLVTSIEPYTFNGVYLIALSFYNATSTLTPQEVYNVLTISQEIATKLDIHPANLIIDNKTYCRLPRTLVLNEKMTMSTSTGDVIGEENRILFYDGNGKYLNYYTFNANVSYRTVQVSESVLNAKYIKLAYEPPMPIMFNFGATALPYKPYLPDSDSVTGFISDYVSRNEEISVTDIHEADKYKIDILRKHYNISNPVENALKIMLFSDVHAEWNRLNRMVELSNAWGTNYFNLGVNCGDTVLAKLGDGVTQYDSAISGCNIPVLNTVGNHDAYSSIGVLATQTDVYNAIIKPVADSVQIVQPENAATLGLCYYYYDSGDYRIIVLDCMYWNADENTWFASVLADAVTNSKKVIAAIHEPFAAQYCQFVDSKWNDSSFYRDSSVSPIAAAQTVKDFIDNDGTFICWLQGHLHADEVYTLPNYGNQLCISTNSFQNRGTKVMKNSDETAYNYDNITFLTVDEQANLVKMYRIGANINMRGQEYHAISYDYVNHAVKADW